MYLYSGRFTQNNISNFSQPSHNRFSTHIVVSVVFAYSFVRLSLSIFDVCIAVLICYYFTKFMSRKSWKQSNIYVKEWDRLFYCYIYQVGGGVWWIWSEIFALQRATNVPSKHSFPIVGHYLFKKVTHFQNTWNSFEFSSKLVCPA
jgi:hypothetical protein